MGGDPAGAAESERRWTRDEKPGTIVAAANLHDGDNGETGRGGATGVAAAGDLATKDAASEDGMVGVVVACDAPESDES